MYDSYVDQSSRAVRNELEIVKDERFSRVPTINSTAGEAGMKVVPCFIICHLLELLLEFFVMIVFTLSMQGFEGETSHLLLPWKHIVPSTRETSNSLAWAHDDVLNAIGIQIVSF